MKFDYSRFAEQATPVIGEDYATKLYQQSQIVIDTVKHGDLLKWQTLLDALPDINLSANDLNADTLLIGDADDCSDKTRQQLYELLQGFCPWRKGPFDICGMKIDTEWRSDWKWQRLESHISPLKNRTVLDIGCGSGYHCWRMNGAGAKLTVGIEPYLLFVMQYWAVRHFLTEPPVFVLPLRFEDMPAKMSCFDTVFSMGVLYHCKKPLEHLMAIREQLQVGGELVLETLIIDESDGDLLEPSGRYAKMRNVNYIPSVATLETWLKKSGYYNIRTVNITTTTPEEQRATDWMKFESLDNYLSPDDSTLTIEDHPAPKRAIVIANIAKK
ncbi:MAG: tRNA 5-methoxyuridine(34)/uridine 5-oxyacetic acid(34) synthase CmoB [Victivallaceae bacterium]|nr:tRNA 5-methoxyuridine(34)/uridine 5-oxyacetic acid(34) synthase CmoB [Victivallaceae bacterium]